MSELRTKRVHLRPSRRMYARANDPAPFIGELLQLGLGHVTCDVSKLPHLDELDPDESYLDFTATIATTASDGEIRDIFEFVAGDCEVVIQSIDG